MRNGRKETIKLTQLSRLVRQKMKANYIPEDLTPQAHKLLQKPFSIFDHECKQPEAGIIISKQSEITDDGGSNSDEKDYKYASLLLVTKNNLESVKEAFLAEGVECEVRHKFERYNLEATANSALLYHDKKLDDMLNIISDNPKFIFGGRPLMMVSITSYLRLQDRSERNPFPAK